MAQSLDRANAPTGGVCGYPGDLRSPGLRGRATRAQPVCQAARPIAGTFIIVSVALMLGQSAVVIAQDDKAADQPAKAAPAEAKQPAAAQPAARPPVIRVLPPVIQLMQPGVQVRRFRGRIGPDGIQAASEGNLNYALFPNNRELVRSLEQAEKLIADERLADAFDVLDAVLGEKQDYFYQRNRDEQNHQSIKTHARRLISGLSAEAIKQYDLQFGATARQMLDKAVAEGNADGVAAVVRRYFNTQAGFEASWLLGRQHLDHGRALAAAMTLEMLFDSPRAREQFEPALSLTLATSWLRAGVRPRAERVLAELRTKGARPRIAQRETPLFTDDASAVEWLVAQTGDPPQAVAGKVANWLFHRGNPARNAPGSGGSPLLSTPRWQQTLANETGPTSAGDAMSKQLVDANDIDLPAETPLAIGDTAVVRTPRWIVGVNLRTGKRIWESLTWENENYAARQQVLNPFTGSAITIVPHKLATRTTMASDGQSVFVVEDRGNQPFLFAGVMGGIRRGGTSTVITAYNKLLARDLATEGKLLWEVGGESGEEEQQLAGVYFLGAPLVMGGQLYVIGELKGEITLFVLNAANGKLDWSQPLATVETPVALDSFRRLHGATPSFADGVMVCPTSAGAVVAVDVANRSLLWGYQYPRNQAMNLNMARRTGEVTDPFGSNRWRDGSVIVASGRAVVTPADSDHLHCINLVDGKEAWKPVPRGDNLFVGGVHGGTVLVVGRRQVQGLELIDGRPSWPAVQLGEEGTGVPSGRGFQSGGHYYLPLSSAEVIKIDLADGTIKSRAKSRKGYVLGNLVCNQGSVLSLNEDSLDCFFQLDEREQWAAETLRVRPDDPDALAMLGEILMDQGKLGEGLEKLEQSFALAPTERVRELLIESHLEQLRQDFAGHRDRADDIEKLLASPQQKAEFAREMAVGLQKLGERLAAFEFYLQMCQTGEPAKELETVVAGELAVRRDRFVRARIAELRAAATSEERRKMDERIEEHLASLGGPAELGALRQFLSYFGDAEAGGLQSTFIARLIEEKAPLEAEWWLLRQARSSNRAEAAAAWLQLAELMQQLDRPDDAASCYRRLARDFGDEAVPDGQTYKQLVESLPAQTPVRTYLAPLEQWPKYAAPEKPLSRNLTFTGAPLDISFGREPFFEHGAIELESNRRELLVRDGLGNERFRTELADNRRAARSVNYSSLPWARANGHILLIQERTQILAIDTLSPDRNGASRVLWRHDLADMIADESGIMIRPAPAAANRRVRPQWFEQRGRPVGGIWPVGHELICLQRGQKLVGIDVFSGEIVWTRNDIPPAEEIFGGEEHLFVVAPGSNEAIVLRTIDGTKVGTRHVPTSDRYLSYGQKVVFFHSLTGKTVVRVYDPWTDQELWRATFNTGARIEPIGSDEFAVMDSSGKLVIYSLHNANVVVETKVDEEKALADLQVFRTADRYVVLAGRHVQYSQGAAHRYAVQNPGARAQPVIDSRAYAFDRQNAKLLWGPIDLPTTATLLNQPAHAPVLVFAMNVNDQSRANSARVQTQVMCLDVRNGVVLCNESLPNGSTTVVAVADPERKKLEIRCNTMTAVLAFSDTKTADKNADSGEPAENEQTDDKGQGANGERERSPPPAPTPDPFDNPFDRK